MKENDHVKHKDGRTGRITEGWRAGRATPKSEGDPNTKATHLSVKWDKTGVEEVVRVEDLYPVPTFSDQALAKLSKKYPDGKGVDREEFTTIINDVAITFEALEEGRVKLTLLRNKLETAEGGPFDLLEEAIGRVSAYEQGRWSPFSAY